MKVTRFPIDQFTECDHLVVRQAIALLPKRELEVIVLRFWEGLSETEIATALRTDWQTIEKLMAKALARLKDTCLSRPEFSRNQVSPVTIQAQLVDDAKSIVNRGMKYGNEVSQ